MAATQNLTVENLANLTDEQLTELRAGIDAELKKRTAKQRQEAKRKIVELAQSHGIKLEELAGQEKIYRNPDNPWGETWNGKGRKPKWVIAALESGKTLADLEAS